MVEVVEGGRLYFPPEDENNPDDRKVMHPETDAEQVLMKNGETLEQNLKTGKIIISADKPEQPCLWGQIVSTRTIED